MNMVIVEGDLLGTVSHFPLTRQGCDRRDAIVVCSLVKITHAYLRDFSCVSIRYFVVRCILFSVLLPNLQTTDLELGALVAESGYSVPEQVFVRISVMSSLISK